MSAYGRWHHAASEPERAPDWHHRRVTWKERRGGVFWLWWPFVFVEWLFEKVSLALRRVALFDVLERLTHLGVLLAVIFFLLDFGERREARIVQAWQVINQARSPAEAGRIRALEYLSCSKRSWWNRFTCERQDLAGIRLEGAMLNGVDLNGAQLNHAQFIYTKLEGADLTEADLRRADLRGADLGGADLRWVRLGGAKISRANLYAVRNLVPQQVNAACISRGDEPPRLPEGWDPPTTICPTEDW